jgi:hypothetical protein
MRSLTLSKYRRAHVWLDEAPPADYAAVALLTRTMRASKAVTPGRRIAAVEIAVPRGPVTPYALLGGRLTDADVDGLELVLSINPTGRTLVPSLATPPDHVQTGLPDEYADAIFSAAEDLAASDGLPSQASLRFEWAAHAASGSSPLAFRQACRLVLQLLMLPADASDGDIDALFEREML